jgi:CubicO group peptidase (beta-lactamase class C family)
MTVRPIRSAIICAAFAALAAPSARAQDSVNDKIDRFVADEMQRQHVPGVGVAVIQRGQVLKAQGYGLANLELRVPVSADTMFQSGSLGKQFTATAVMLQVEDGKLALSDPLTKFFPDAPAAWRNITVRHLLTHTSGIPDYTEGVVDLRKDYTEDELAKFAFGLPLEFPAGTRWNYSNTGYVLLGIIVHKVSGSFYGDVLATRVFKPLGMATARVIDEADIIPNRAAGYQLEKGEVKNQDWVAPKLNTTADGSLYFSLRDLIAWDAGVRSRAILKADSWTQILTPVTLTSGKTYPYGFGWFIEERGGKPLQGHSGSWQGFKTQFSRFLGDDLSIVVLANLAQANPTRFADGVAAIVDPALAVPPLTPIEDRDPQMTSRASQFLESARAGTLTPADLAYTRAGFFPDIAKRVQARLQPVTLPATLVLVKRVEMGDDRISTYEVKAGARMLLYTIGFAPDGKVSILSVTEK